MSNYRKVWLVDDDKIYRFASQRYINEVDSSIAVSAFDQTQLALDKLNAMSADDPDFPELILLDVNMPVLDGWDFMEEFDQMPAEKRQQLRVFVVSSSIDEKDMERAEAHEAVGRYIIKPVMQDDFKELLKNNK